MFSYLWPIALIVFSNVIYHICTKSVPASINPFASLTITYLIGAIISAVLYFVLTKNGNLLQEFRQLNWSSFILGLSIVGLEAGTIYAYKAGWPISAMSIVNGSVLAIMLIIVGKALYNESITISKLIGIALCLFGLYFINK